MSRLRFELVLWPVVSVASLAVVIAVAAVEAEWIVAGLVGVVGIAAIRPLFRVSRLVRHMDVENPSDSRSVSREQYAALSALDRFDDGAWRVAREFLADASPSA